MDAMQWAWWPLSTRPRVHVVDTSERSNVRSPTPLGTLPTLGTEVMRWRGVGNGSFYCWAGAVDCGRRAGVEGRKEESIFSVPVRMEN